ncbi:MAG: glycosyltransferase family 1 protein [Ramlibacter sp.]|nr:glycosyltransferase family 1 protein [Ramlibacter sp.]
MKSAAMGRLLFDVSFTRTQARPAGISRTVARLLESMARAGTGDGVLAVSFHSSGLRRPTAGWMTAAAPQPATTGNFSLGATRSWLTEGLAPRVSALLPMALRRWAWTTFHRLRFDRISRGDVAVEVRTGDVLFLGDASWNYEIWKAAKQVRAAGGRVVLMVHDIMPIRQPGFCSPIFAWMFVRWLTKVLACSDAVVCNSKATEDDLRSWAASAGLDLPPTRHFRLGHDATGVGAAGPVRPQLARFTAGDVPCFASVGTFEPKKNYGFLLDAFEQLWDRGLPMRLVIAGRPAAQAAAVIQRLLGHPERDRRLLTLLDASDAEIAHLYGHCRALVLASRFEGFGLPLVEARTQGCAVIASDLPVFRELADEGVFLFAQDSREELQQWVVRLADQAPEAPLPRMAPFSWDDSARQCLAAMEEMLRPRAAPPQRARAAATIEADRGGLQT